MRRPKTLKQKIETRIVKTRKADVFLLADFKDFSDTDQIQRALRALVREGVLMRLGYGVYARAMQSRLSGRMMVDSANGFHSAALQALNKLGVPWEPSESTRAYNEGRSTQIPVNLSVKVKNRFQRRLSDGHTELRFEK